MKFDQVQKSITLFLPHFLVLLLCFFLIRIVEFEFWIELGDKPRSLYTFFLFSYLFDVVFLCAVYTVVLILVNILFYKSPQRQVISAALVFLLILIGQILLVYFFCTNNVLYDFSSNSFRAREIVQIIAPELSLKIIPILLLTLIGIFCMLKTSLNPKFIRTRTNALLPIGLLAICLSGLHILPLHPNSAFCSTSFETHLTYNKFLYSWDGFLHKKREKEWLSSILSNPDSTEYAIKSLHRELDYFEFINDSFPLYRRIPSSNSLGPFFEHSDRKPNIVLIICESLSRSISGPNAFYGSLTPFLDSLANDGLYWDHFLSNSPATEGALPSILASLPTGTRDKFLYRLHDNPSLKFNSTTQLLKQNGYVSSFHYPGWIGFTHMDDFLKKSAIDSIYSHTHKDPSSSETSWGTSDKELFDNFIRFKKKQSLTKPQIDILLTISMHSPFQDYKKNQNSTQLARYKQASNLRSKLLNQNSDYLDVANSTVYFDLLLKSFIDSLSHIPGFANTIFIITGDHNIRTLPLSHELDAYHVPLIIWSPLLKRNKMIKSVNSHIDITPSILALLKNNFNCSVPNENHFIGRGLDTSSSFESAHVFPLKLYSSAYPSFIYQNYVLTPSGIKSFRQGFLSKNVTDPQLTTKIKSSFDQFRIIDNYIVEKNRIRP